MDAETEAEHLAAISRAIAEYGDSLVADAYEYADNRETDVLRVIENLVVDEARIRTDQILALTNRINDLQAIVTDRLLTTQLLTAATLTPTSELWTAYGPGVNETYGSGNNSHHRHDPQMVQWGHNTATLLAAKVDGEYLSGAISTREAPNGTGFYGIPADAYGINFWFDLELSDYNHAVWPSVWLRGEGGSSESEIDVMEGFFAQVLPEHITQTLHHHGSKAGKSWPHPAVPMRFSVAALITKEPAGGLRIRLSYAAPGDDHTATVDQTVDLPQDYTWDIIAQQQIGGNWVGDPTKPYTGLLQNGQPGVHPNAITEWDGSVSTLTLHNIGVAVVNAS